MTEICCNMGKVCYNVHKGDGKKKDAQIQWHPAFVAAIDLELAANRDDLVYEKEYNLNIKPLEIDLLVVKKESDTIIENQIGRLFHGHNIMEYKSPGDHLDIDTFYKAQGYACLYKSYGQTVDERKAADITVSIVRQTRPAGLFRYLKNHGAKVSAPYPGIYYVEGVCSFPTQIIVGQELEGENHAWLKALSDQIDPEGMKGLLERIQKLEGKHDQVLADAVLKVSARANQQIVDELRGDGNMYEVLLEIMAPEVNKIVEERVAQQVEQRVAQQVEQRVEQQVKQRVEQQVKQRVEQAAKEAEIAAKKAAKEANDAAEKKAKKETIALAAKLLKSGKFTAEEILEYVPQLSPEEVRNIAARLVRGEP